MSDTCLFFVNCTNIHYCLKFKEWNEPCPSKCPYFRNDVIKSVADDWIGLYDLDCDFLTKELNFNDEYSWFCLFTLAYEPYCSSCPQKISCH